MINIEPLVNTAQKDNCQTELSSMRPLIDDIDDIVKFRN